MHFSSSVPVWAKSWNDARLAVVSLVVLQVGFGVLHKETRGEELVKNAFSPSGSVFLAEFLKLAVSTALFFCEWLWRRDDFNYWTVENRVDGDPSEMATGRRATKKSWWKFPRAFLREVRKGSVVGFAQLAMLYAVINNDVFVLFRVADPGTVQLLNSGIALVAAVVMVVTLGTGFGELQWIAIVTQARPPLCGLVVSQFSPETTAVYPAITCVFVLVYISVSAFTAVYNQSLNQASNISLHADNMVLFSAGSCINLVTHIVVRWWNPEEPGLFTGYTDSAALILVLRSAFVGLASTAVYRYADVVIGCFATSVSTGILLLASALIFQSGVGLYSVSGIVVVFLAVWLYSKATKEQETGWVPVTTETSPPSSPTSRRSWNGKDEARDGLLSGCSIRTGGFGWVTIAIRAAATIAIVVASTTVPSRTAEKQPGWPGELTPGELLLNGSSADSPQVLKSPFNNTLAFVRWNSDHRERIPMIEMYRPFFYDIHYSIPGFTEGSNLTADGFEEAFLVYDQVANTMKLLLEEQPDIDGLLFYHFDAWIDPTRFDSMDFDKIWFPDSIQPRFMCLEDIEALPWLFETKDDARRAKQAAKVLSYNTMNGTVPGGYEANPDEFCDGWADIYYIPRRYFQDYINLSSIFNKFTVFHEIAIPTMVNIIDKTRRLDASYGSSIVEILDCWGSCCAKDPKKEDLTWKKCGHKLNYLDVTATMGFYERLAQSARWLGTPGPHASGDESESKCGWASNPWWSGWMCPDILTRRPASKYPT